MVVESESCLWTELGTAAEVIGYYYSEAEFVVVVQEGRDSSDLRVVVGVPLLVVLLSNFPLSEPFSGVPNKGANSGIDEHYL